MACQLRRNGSNCLRPFKFPNLTHFEEPNRPGFPVSSYGDWKRLMPWRGILRNRSCPCSPSGPFRGPYVENGRYPVYGSTARLISIPSSVSRSGGIPSSNHSLHKLAWQESKVPESSCQLEFTRLYMCGCSPVCKSFFDTHRAAGSFVHVSGLSMRLILVAGRYGVLRSGVQNATKDSHWSGVEVWFTRSRSSDRLLH